MCCDGARLLVGHIFGAHFNPVVTIAFASTKRVPWKRFSRTLPFGTHAQAFVVEFIITFFLMFFISGVATDNRAIGELAGIAIGATVLLNVRLAGPITGASMNPTRSLGPALVHNEFGGIWIYLVSPTFGVVDGARVYGAGGGNDLAKVNVITGMILLCLCYVELVFMQV
ncbi:hypothetical protein ACSQ67_005747 [Phaseolus vulgaris]